MPSSFNKLMMESGYLELWKTSAVFSRIGYFAYMLLLALLSLHQFRKITSIPAKSSLQIASWPVHASYTLQNILFSAFTWSERRCCRDLARGRCAVTKLSERGASRCKNLFNVVKITSSWPLCPFVVAFKCLHCHLLEKTQTRVSRQPRQRFKECKCRLEEITSSSPSRVKRKPCSIVIKIVMFALFVDRLPNLCANVFKLLSTLKRFTYSQQAPPLNIRKEKCLGVSQTTTLSPCDTCFICWWPRNEFGHLSYT